MTLQIIDKNTIIQNFKDQGIKIIPVKPITKKPDVPDFAKYLSGEKVYDSEILPEQNYGVICGKISDNLAVIDVEKIHPDDYHNKTPKPRHIPLENDFINLIIPDCKDETFTTKTGSENYHILAKGEQIPEKTKSFIYEKDHDNIYKIDFKVTGHCVEAGSIHENGKPYEMVSNVLTIKRINLQSVLVNLEKIGFKPVGKDANIETQDDFNSWTIDELLNGSWSRGERRRKQKSLYCKLRRNKETIQQVKQTITKINESLDDPLDKDELDYNFDVAEKYFQKVVLPQWGYQSEQERQTSTSSLEDKIFHNADFDIVSKKIQSEVHFVTIRENKEIWYYNQAEGIYKSLGDTIIAELCQKYIHKCKKQTVAEVIDTIRRNKTMIYMADLMESRDINTQNGILDPRTFELKPHSYEYLTTTKLPFSVNPKARNLKLWKHILTIIDPYDINKFMELVWILISWNNPHKKEFVFKGETNTQKSALVKIITWIIDVENLSKQRAKEYLQKDRRFGTYKFIGKRGNIETEIGGLTRDMLEQKKSMIGGELQNTERKGDNTEYIFDPEHFVFISTTNDLGEVYSTIDDDSAIGRYQFMICRNKLIELDGLWYEKLFENEEDKQSTIDTIVSIVINYKKAQSLGKIPKTIWSNIEETKQILREQMPIEDKYFEDERIIKKEGSRLTLEEIKKDFESFVRYKIKNNQEMGHILKKNGITSTHSNGKTIYKGYAFNTTKDQTILN